MKNKLFLTGMLAMALTFGLVLTGCPTDADDDGGGNTPGTPPAAPPIAVANISELEAKIKERAVNTAAAPYKVELPVINISGTDNNTTSNWARVNTAVQNAERYVILDLGKCTFAGNTVAGSNNGSTGMNIFKANVYIKGIVLPASVTSIGEYAFEGCAAFTSVTIPANVTSIGEYAFFGTALTSIPIPAGVTSIGDGAFRNCTALTSVTIPAGVTSIGVSTFRDCTALTSVTIPASVESIGDYAFYGCAALTSVTIPANVTSIGGHAFEGCSKLASVTIPANVSSIGSQAFSGCTALISVRFEGSAITDANFGVYAFPQGTNGEGGDNLETAYLAGGAGTYTRTAGDSNWAK
jgi:hypothetical protein